MGQIAVVIHFLPGAKPSVKCDLGAKQIVTAEHYAGLGEDTHPLPGDFVIVERSSGSGRWQVTGYYDPHNAGAAAPGERRTYARTPDGSLACVVHCKASGEVSIESLLPGSVIDLNGVKIDRLGNISAPGDVG